MKGRKNILRIGTLLAILMFLLIPLLSQPVTATITWSAGTLTTDNTGFGPSATGTQASGSTLDDGSGTVIISCSYLFQDSGGGGLGSNHWANIAIQKTSTNPPGPVIPAGIGPVFISAGGQSVSGVLQVQDTYTPAQKPVTWTIQLNVLVIPVAGGSASWASSQPHTFTVT